MRNALNKLLMCYRNVGWGFAPGHYYSPVISVDDLRVRQDAVWPAQVPRKIESIELQETDQMALLQELLPFYREVPYLAPTQPASARYYSPNEYFPISDATMLQCLLRRLAPKRVVEIGSGFSSAVMLDTNQMYMQRAVQFTFVDPYPERLLRLLRDDDKAACNVEPRSVQSVSLSVFDQLAKNDILFIDSSHVSKTGSDVNYILFEILPRLQSGVIIHFHDVFWPFEYPKASVLEKKLSWNEAYMLRAFLMCNKEYRVVLFGHFLKLHHGEWYQSHMPRMLEDPGGSLWLQKL